MKWILAAAVILWVLTWIAFDVSQRPRAADDWMTAVVAGVLAIAAAVCTVAYMVGVMWSHDFW